MDAGGKKDASVPMASLAKVAKFEVTGLMLINFVWLLKGYPLLACGLVDNCENAVETQYVYRLLGTRGCSVY